MWDAHELVHIASKTLAAASRGSVEEQAVHGIDALSEVELHPLLARGYSGAGYGVVREHCYPGDASLRAKASARSRCDLVLLPEPGLRLLDPVKELIEQDRAAGTLFEPVAAVAQSPGVRPEEAFWLEVKVVGQYTYTQGVPGPNRAYGSELTGSLYIDLAKIGADAALTSSGLLLVMFTDTLETAKHDLTVALHRSLDRGYSFRSPVSESFEIPDRIGNSTCAVHLVPR